MKPLQGHVAVVAGATRGAGRGIARMLGEAGATVYCSGRSSRTQPNTKLILVDCVVPETDEPHFSKFIDLNMLVMTGGKERTEAEFSELFERAGFNLVKVHATESPVTIVEGVRR